MWPSGSRPRLGIVGNPENRRVRDFQAAVEELGLPRPPCLAYETLLRDPEVGFDVDVLRLESPGENEAVTAGLVALGGGPSPLPLSYGEIGFTREYHRGFCQVLGWLERRGLPCLNAPRDIATMFDKLACHELFLQHGVARPPARLAPAHVDELFAEPSGRVFLKPLHGSSASGVCALSWRPGRQQLIAPLRLLGSVLVNSLQIQRYENPADIRAILTPLLRAGMICERWIPKLTLAGGAVDLRVLVIGGEARHRVVRQSRHPMTNLHLGNRRGDEALLDRLDEALRLAERAAACFPNSLYAGVDVLLDTSGRPLIGEINAFGDLLPRLTHRGESAYTAIARHARCLV